MTNETRINRSPMIAVILLSGLAQACVTTTGGQRPASDEEAALANLDLGVAYLRQGRPELALENLERAIDLDPRLAAAHSTIALTYDQLGQPESAGRHYRRATELEPADAAAQNSYAVFLCRRDRWEEAERYFNRAASNPSYAAEVALTNAGICAAGADASADAERYLRAALEHDPNFADALSNMMELSYRQGNYLQARAFMQRSFAARQPDARQLWLCYRIERELGDSNAADDCAARLARDFPDSSELAQLREFERDAGQ